MALKWQQQNRFDFIVGDYFSLQFNPSDNRASQNFPTGPGTGIPRAHLSLAEKKRLEWQQENGRTIIFKVTFDMTT